MVDNADVVRTAAVQVEHRGDPLTEVAGREPGERALGGFGPAIAEKLGDLADRQVAP